MKKILAILFVFLFAGSFGNADIFDDIANSLRSGDARAVSRFFGNTVDLTIINQEEVYSKMQAEQILRDFFSKNTPRSFNIIHQGVKEGARYAIGNLTTTQGVVFRTYFFVKTQSGNSMIQELRFMKE